jgi:TPR repeat protein
MRIWLAVWGVIVLAVSAALLAAAPAALRAAHLGWPAWPVALAGAVVTALAALAGPLTTVITRSWANSAQRQISSRDQARQVERDLTGHDKGLPLTSQVTDRAVLGIHPAIPLPAGSDPALPADLPLYVARDIDSDLRAWISARRQSGGFLLITGPAAAGKTRTACQLIHDAVPDWALFMPATAGQLTAYIHSTPATGKLVIWLNEIQSYLGPEGLTAAVIRRALAGPRPVIIVGTIWPERYDTLAAVPAPAAGKGDQAVGLAQNDPGSDAREILTILAHRVDLLPAFTPAERRRARSLATQDPRIAEALAHGPNLPETLAAAPDLIHRWLAAADPCGAAIITAAVAARRCGHPQPLPPSILRLLAQHALTPEQRAGARPDWFPAALRWARAPVRGLAAPLTAQAAVPARIQGDNVSDILVQHATGNSAAPWHHVPDAAWQLLIDHAAPAACLEIAAAAYPDRAARRVPIALRAARKAAEAGHPSAMDNLGTLLQEQGDNGMAERWYRDAARAGHPGAMTNLGFLLAQRGEAAEAERWYRDAAEAGHFGAMSNLGFLLAQRGDANQAGQWHRKAARAGQIIAGPRREVQDRGNIDQAEQQYRQAAEQGDGGSMSNLGILLERQGDTVQAEQWLRRAADTDDYAAAGAMFNLGGLFQRQGKPDEAERWYRKAAAAGHTAAMTSLGILLASQGHLDQAGQWYRKAAAAGYTDAMHKLGELLAEQGRPDQADHKYGKSAVAPRTSPQQQ